MESRTYDHDDALNRREFGNLLYAFFRSEYLFAYNLFVVALTGGFGSGKSHIFGNVGKQHRIIARAQVNHRSS
jgi:hypothetical protein